MEAAEGGFGGAVRGVTGYAAEGDGRGGGDEMSGKWFVCMCVDGDIVAFGGLQPCSKRCLG